MLKKSLDVFNWILLQKTLALYILLENRAAHKNSIGSKFEEINILMEKLGNKQFGVCFDTCNAFASEYDLRTSEKVIETIKNFNDKISITILKILHLNDSKSKLNENKNRHEPTIIGSLGNKVRHEHIGFGLIGKEGFKEILNNKYFKNIPIIMDPQLIKSEEIKKIWQQY